MNAYITEEEVVVVFCCLFEMIARERRKRIQIERIFDTTKLT